MRVEVKLVNGDLVAQALRKVPADAHDAILTEMRGMEGLAVEWKVAIAKTFVGRMPGATRRGEKWIYSKKSGPRDSGLYHHIRPGSLDTLQMTIGAKPAAALHELGGTIQPNGMDLLAVPIGDARWMRRGTRRLRPHDLFDARSVRTRSGRILLGEPDDEEGGRLKFYFELKREVRNPGGRLRFRATTGKMRNRAVQRFERALTRVVKQFDRAA